MPKSVWPGESGSPGKTEANDERLLVGSFSRLRTEDRGALRRQLGRTAHLRMTERRRAHGYPHSCIRDCIVVMVWARAKATRPKEEAPSLEASLHVERICAIGLAPDGVHQAGPVSRSFARRSPHATRTARAV